MVDLLRVVLMDEDMSFDFDIEEVARGVRALADKRRAANIVIINILSYCSRVKYLSNNYGCRARSKDQNADSSRQIANIFD